jgi:hypothetical protein
MTAARITELGEHIRSMDQSSQTGFDRIEVLARLAQLAMQVPEAYRSNDDFFHIFEMIGEIAATTMNDINAEAEEAGGFQYRDPAADVRQDARYRWLQMMAETVKA